MSGERRPIVAGNWKMNTTYDEARALAAALLPVLSGFPAVDRVLIPPFPWIVPLADMLASSDVGLGAQDCAIEDAGAFTGAVSARMLAPFCDYVIVGHSERRHIFGETDATVAGKYRAALRNGIRPILCVGELLPERQAGQAEAVVQRQLTSALEGASPDEVAATVIAYEPVWAIGTGQAATPDDARSMAIRIREIVARLTGAEVAEAVRVQYGGSVTGDNAAGFLELPEIDGALVGGASLKVEQFARIVEVAAGRQPL